MGICDVDGMIYQNNLFYMPSFFDSISTIFVASVSIGLYYDKLPRDDWISYYIDIGHAIFHIMLV